MLIAISVHYSEANTVDILLIRLTHSLCRPVLAAKASIAM